MVLIVGMAIGLAIIHAIGAYLRYLPFEAKLSGEERARLWRYISLWMPVAVILYAAYFGYAGLDVVSYKRVHYYGWIPFFAFSLVVIRNEVMRHIFVGGMQTIWFLLLQTVSGTLILTMMPSEIGESVMRLPVQTSLYIFFFVVTLPLERRIFRKLLPPRLFAGNRLAGWCFAFLPFGLCAAPLITLIDRPLMYTWTDRFARFFLLFWGFTLYQYALYAGDRAARIRNEQHTNELLTQQLQALESHAALLQSRADDIRRARHDLRHYNQLLATLIRAGESDRALDLIEAQDKGLLTRPIDAYCQSPIINAALTIFMQVAKKDGITASCTVDIDNPECPREGDGDLAILLANVIENAVIASRKQPEGQREVRVSLAYDAMQYALVVKNRCDAPLTFGEDGLPTTSEQGHGTGMVSVRSFGKKYGAETIFEQKDGWVRFLMYWSGEKKIVE